MADRKMSAEDYDEKLLAMFPHAPELGLTEAELELLVDDYYDDMLNNLEVVTDDNTREDIYQKAMASLSEHAAKVAQPQFAGAVEKTEANIKKLSKGFALRAEMLDQFLGDMFIANDIKEALHDPDSPPATYPNNFVTATYVFIAAASEYLDDRFWHREEDFYQLKDFSDRAKGYGHCDDWPHDKAALVYLFHHYLAGKVLGAIADEFRDQKRANLATIEDGLGRKNQAAANEILSHLKDVAAQNAALPTAPQRGLNLAGLKSRSPAP